MEMMKGTPISFGTAHGPIVFLSQTQAVPSAPVSGDPEEETRRWEEACTEANRQLEALRQERLESGHEEVAEILEIQQLFLEDEDVVERVACELQGGCSAQTAADRAFGALAEEFEGMEEPYMQARSADVRDLWARLTHILTRGKGGSSLEPVLSSPCILVAEDLLPSQLMGLPTDKLLGIALSAGVATSHTAVVIRALGIPAVFRLGPELLRLPEGTLVALDGGAGALYSAPTPDLLARWEHQAVQETESAHAPLTFRGRPVGLYANTSSPQDVALAKNAGAEGIGLFRSEFLFLNRDTWPTREEQLAVYQQAAKAVDGPVIIRTMDIGADKQAPYMGLPEEANPAMGNRGIRFSLAHLELFQTQISAIVEAAMLGHVGIMLPMVSTLEEVRRARQRVEEVISCMGSPLQLGQDIPFGVMIETPAAALISQELAKEVDFFSIGTNDLAQFTFGADRQNGALEEGLLAPSAAVLRLIEMCVTHAHQQGIWVGVCGEWASDPQCAVKLLELGVDELSLSPRQIPRLRTFLSRL